MAQIILKSLFWVIGILAISMMVIVGVTDAQVFHEHFYGDTQLVCTTYPQNSRPLNML